MTWENALGCGLEKFGVPGRTGQLRRAVFVRRPREWPYGGRPA